MSPLSLSDFEAEALSTLMTYATLPCLSPAFDHEWENTGAIDQAIELFADFARARCFGDAEVRIHRLQGHTPVLTVTIEATAPVSGTTVLYGHLDKQPPLGDWSEGLGPFTPVRRGDRIYARGVADDGYAIFAALLAIETMERDGHAHGRCVVLIEASEESGSVDLEDHLDALKDHLGEVELMICLDSGALTYDRLWVTTSLRGLVNVEVTVRVLSQGSHSGSASGVVPSSFRVMRQLIERLEDAATGEVLLPALHATIPPAHLEAARGIAEEFGDVVARELPTLDGVDLMGDSPTDRIMRRTWHPTLSLIGVGGVPEPAHAGNVLRPFTTAVLSFRLPPTVKASDAAAAIEAALLAPGAASSEVQVTIVGDADGWVTPSLAPWLARALEEASTDAFGTGPGFIGEGGSIPFLASLGRRYPEVQFVATGALGPHSNAHGIDEMLDLPTAVKITNAVATILGAFAREKASR